MYFTSASAGLDLVLDQSGWIMLFVLVMNHASSPAQTGELEYITVTILKMWQFTAKKVCVLMQALHLR